MYTVLLALLPLLGLTAPLADARKINIKNSCTYTIWPGFHSNPGPPPDHATGWKMDSGASDVLDVSDAWQSGRIFARTGCTVQDGVFSCLTGNCGNGPVGAGKAGDISCINTDEPPATLAEFTLSKNGKDHYDISLVDGFNIPMTIHASKPSCKSPKCDANINAVCPPLLRTGIDDTGANLGCLHPCNAGFGKEQWGSRACCNFGYNDPTLCSICGVDYYNVFKDACPEAYAYAYDEKSGTALWTCESTPGNMSDYTVEFCPNSASYIGPTTANLKYANATATCSNMATTWTMPPNVTWPSQTAMPNPTTTITKGTLKVVATNMPNVGGQAAIADGTGSAGGPSSQGTPVPSPATAPGTAGAPSSPSSPPAPAPTPVSPSGGAAPADPSSPPTPAVPSQPSAPAGSPSNTPPAVPPVEPKPVTPSSSSDATAPSAPAPVTPSPANGEPASSSAVTVTTTVTQTLTPTGAAGSTATPSTPPSVATPGTPAGSGPAPDASVGVGGDPNAGQKDGGEKPVAPLSGPM